MEKMKYYLDSEFAINLKELIGKPLKQVDFEKIIQNCSSGSLPITIWAGDRGVAIHYGVDEFPISPFDDYPLSYLVQGETPEHPKSGTDRLVHLRNQRLSKVGVIRVGVKGFYNNNEFLDLEMDLSLVLHTELGFIALQRTYLDDFAVNIQLGSSGDELKLLLPSFDDETDLEYRYEITHSVITLT